MEKMISQSQGLWLAELDGRLYDLEIVREVAAEMGLEIEKKDQALIIKGKQEAVLEACNFVLVEMKNRGAV